MQTAGLFVLLGRLGGRATFTEEEYKQIQARYGGSSRIAIRMEILRAEGQPEEIQLTLVNKPPANAELVV
jgi:hypothetical protein